MVASVAAVGLWLVLQMLVVQVFTVRAGSMKDTLAPGDRVLVLRPAVDRDLARGDVVVVDVRGSFIPGRAVTGPRAGSVLAPAPPEAYVVKRAVAGPGDRLRCCDDAGRLVLNGTALQEPYLPEGVAPSTDTFDVVVGEGRWWLMGDNRAVSDDSRSHLGSPGGGTVRDEAIIGRVVGVVG